MIGLLFSLNSFALDVDSKLTLRILKTSISKKTILINRGLEDGLVVGDHAKFFLTDGVVARGLVIKASPSRSVWSLYRVIRIEEIRDQKVVNLKISTPVKVTADPTKSLNSSPIIAGREVMVERSDGQIDLKIDGNSNADKEEMKTLYGREVVSHKTYADGTMELDKTWDIILSMGTQSLAVSDPNAVDSTTEATQGSILMGIGLEKYFPKLELDFARKFSFLMFMNKSSFAVEAVDLSVTGTSMDFGIEPIFFEYYSKNIDRVIAWSHPERISDYYDLECIRGKKVKFPKLRDRFLEIAEDPEASSQMLLVLMKLK